MDCAKRASAPSEFLAAEAIFSISAINYDEPAREASFPTLSEVGRFLISFPEGSRNQKGDFNGKGNLERQGIGRK